MMDRHDLADQLLDTERRYEATAHFRERDVRDEFIDVLRLTIDEFCLMLEEAEDTD